MTFVTVFKKDWKELALKIIKSVLNQQSVTPTLHIGNGCIPGSTGNGNPIGSEPGATRRKKAIIKPESLNANEVNLLQKTDI